MRRFFVFVTLTILGCGITTAAQCVTLRDYRLKNKLYQLNRTCMEIGRTATVTKDCLSPSVTYYKGVPCFKCANSMDCNPPCRGGKLCINKRCVCPSYNYMVDCNGKCIPATTKCVIK